MLGGISTGGLVATDDEHLHRAVTTMRGHGHDSSTGEFTRLGVNSRMSSANAAVLLNHLRHQAAWRDARARVAEQYRSGLAALPLLLPPGPTAGSLDNHHKYVLRTAYRDEIRRHLDQHGILTKVHYHRALPDHAALAGHGRCHGRVGAAHCCAAPP